MGFLKKLSDKNEKIIKIQEKSMLKKGYTKDELEYNQKSANASIFGAGVASFGFTGFKKSPKIRTALTALGLVTDIGLSNYYDAKSFIASKKKTRNFTQSWVRGFSSSWVGAHLGVAAAGVTSFGLGKLRKQTLKVANNETARFYKATPVNKAAGLGQMIKDKAIRFIRVRGRIVPIRGKSTRLGPALLAAPKG